MLYDAKGIQDVLDKFSEYKQQLIAIAGDGQSKNDTSSDLGHAAATLTTAWSSASGQESGALTSFQSAKSQWDAAYSEHGLEVLDHLAAGLKDAMERALSADSRVSDMFSHHW